MKTIASIVAHERRKAMVPLAVTRLLASFKSSTDAYDVATFNGWRGRTHVPADTTSPAQLWDTIGDLACLEVDWSPFKIRLVRSGESEVACRCGAHFVTAFLICRRWTLLVLGRQTLATPLSELLPIRNTTIEKLARLLPHLEEGERITVEPLPGDPRGGGGTAGPAELAIPLWWVRRSN